MANVETSMNLPSEAAILPPGQKKKRQLQRDAEFKNFLERNNVLTALSRSIAELYTRYTTMRPHHDPVEYFLEVLAEFVPLHPEQDELESEIHKLNGMLAEIRQDCLLIQEKLNIRKPESLKIYRDYSTSESETDDTIAQKPNNHSLQNRRRQKIPSLGTRWECGSSSILPSQSDQDKVSYCGKSVLCSSGRHQV